MMKSEFKLLVALLALIVMASARTLPTPFPAFQIVSSANQTISTSQLPSSDRWLLIYIQPQCGTCQSVLKLLLNQNQLPTVLPKTIVLVGGAGADKVSSIASTYPDLPVAQWYGDPQRNGVSQLALTGAPVIFGLHQGNIQWTLAGALPDTDKFKSILTSWIQGN